MHTWDSSTHLHLTPLPPPVHLSLSISLCVWDVFDWRRAPVTPGSEPSIPLEAVSAPLPTPLEVSCRWHAGERAADCRVPEPGERASCHDAPKKRSLFPGGLFLPEVRHVSAPAPFKSGFSAPEETRASPGLVPVSGASRCSHRLMMSLLWSSPRCCVAYLKSRNLTNLRALLHQLLSWWLQWAPTVLRTALLNCLQLWNTCLPAVGVKACWITPPGEQACLSSPGERLQEDGRLSDAHQGSLDWIENYVGLVLIRSVAALGGCMEGGSPMMTVNSSPAVAANAEGEEIEVLETTDINPVAPEDVSNRTLPLNCSSNQNWFSNSLIPELYDGIPAQHMQSVAVVMVSNRYSGPSAAQDGWL